MQYKNNSNIFEWDMTSSNLKQQNSVNIDDVLYKLSQFTFFTSVPDYNTLIQAEQQKTETKIKRKNTVLQKKKIEVHN